MLAVVWGRRVADSGQILQFLRALKAPKTVPKEKKIVGLVMLGGENRILCEEDSIKWSSVLEQLGFWKRIRKEVLHCFHLLDKRMVLYGLKFSKG